MPYGGVKDPAWAGKACAYAIEEMTEPRLPGYQPCGSLEASDRAIRLYCVSLYFG